MEKELSLVILAAGLGSRFGGLKQIEGIGPNNEFIIDYSIYDAIKAGFNKVIFVIKKENYEVFKETIGKRIEDKIKVKYVFQELNDIPEGYSLPKDRIKPLGTAQAVYAARNEINGNFAIINADDFYGRESFEILKEELTKEYNDDKGHYTIIGYKVANTMTENGSVKRGVCKTKKDLLEKLIESKIERIGNEIIATPLDGKKEFKVEEETLVSMNMIGFTQDIMKHIEEKFVKFLDDNKNNLDTCEYLIPDVIYKTIEEQLSEVKVIKTNAKWYGVTYKEDLAMVKAAIGEFIQNGTYPEVLFRWTISITKIPMYRNWYPIFP